MSIDLSVPPGGMSQAQLRAELDEYGIDHSKMKWIDLINEVGHQRHTRESIAAQTQSPLLVLDAKTKDYVFNGHAGTGPSGAERWMTCTASLSASRAFLETLTDNQRVEFSKAGEAARQGTTAHAAAEAEALVMIGQISEDELDQTLLELAVLPDTAGEAYDDEMAEFITEYTDLVKQYHDSGRTVLIEQSVEAAVPLMTVDEDGDPEVYFVSGSADCIAMPSKDENVLTVADLKYGQGKDVDVEQNPQIRIYALGALGALADPETGELPDLESIEYIIAQPRLGGIKVWSESLDDLLAWRDEVLSPALTEALAGPKGGAAYRPTELACQWCPARGTCAALAESRVAEAAELFDVIVESEFIDGPGTFPETETLSDERLGALYTQIRGLTKIADDLKAETQRRLHRGVKVPGFQLVSYTPTRKWKPEAAEALVDFDELMSTKLVSPTQAEKILKDEYADIADLVEVPPKRPIVAPEGDRRKPWSGPLPEDMFSIEEEA